jgi:tetratricopeptide (TPR) repeat protein
MKIKFLMAGLLGLVSITAFAQKGELSNAQADYEKYVSLRGAKAMATMANTSLNTARVAIDKASVNAKTAELPLTFALKAEVYSALALQDTIETTSLPLYNTAYAAVKKATEADTKGENKKLIDDANHNLAQYSLNVGVKQYSSANYDLAYKAFDQYRQILPDDTNAMYYTGLSAANASRKDAKFYPLAIENYKKLAVTKFSRNPTVYLDMSTMYLLMKDTVNSLKVAGEGATKYPTNSELRKREIEIALQTGKQNDIIGKLEGAIANDPKNKTIYYYAGLTYSSIGDVASTNQDKAKVEAAKASFQKVKLDNYTKAAEMYKKAIEIDPNYFEANLNLGYVLERPAIDVYNAANKLPANKQKEYDAAVAKAGIMFDIAKPYLIKAVELNPKSPDALTNLLSYYRGKKDNANASKIKAQLDEVKAASKQ